MRVLVFGASSQIGHFLLPRLRDAGAEVVAVSRQSRGSAGVTWLRGELPHVVPPVGALSAVVSFGPLQGLADWL